MAYKKMTHAENLQQKRKFDMNEILNKIKEIHSKGWVMSM